MSEHRTRVTTDPLSGKYQAQYFDDASRVWFDIGDAQESYDDADMRQTYLPDLYSETQTIIDGWYGQYAPDALIGVAGNIGFPFTDDDGDVVEYASARMDSIGPGTPSISEPDNYFELSIWLSDAIVEWINDNRVADGFLVDWHEGDLYCAPLCDDDESCTADECWHRLGT